MSNVDTYLDAIHVEQIVGDIKLVSDTGKWTRRDPWIARLFGPVDKVGGCWVRTIGVTAQGYTHITAEGSTWRAHRLSWTVLRGDIPEGLTIDHLCRNPPCINPDHLEPVTLAENCRRRHGWLGATCSRGHDTTVTGVGSHGRCRVCWNEYQREFRRGTRRLA